MKNCWKCAEQIQDAALVCRFCNAPQDQHARFAAADGAFTPIKSTQKNSLGCGGFMILAVLAFFLIGKCAGDTETATNDTAYTPPPYTSPDEAAKKLKECASVVAKQKRIGLIRSVKVDPNVMDRVFATVVVNERLWNRASYEVKMSAMMAPLCEYMRGYPTGTAMTRAVSDLTRKSLGSGTPGEGTLTVEN
jgi:hypothetical protein